MNNELQSYELIISFLCTFYKMVVTVTATLLIPHFKKIDMKTITFETHFNKKLRCETFCHISMAPLPGASVNLGSTTVSIRVKDDPDHIVTAVLIDALHCNLEDIREYFTQLSHNMSRQFFKTWWLEKYPGKTHLTVYFYKRLTVVTAAG